MVKTILRNRKSVVSEIDLNVEASRVVIYACSGCSDAGELADRTARALSQNNLGEMSCLAGIGGRVKPLMSKAEKAGHIVAIDGCPLNCSRHTLEQAGFSSVHHLELHSLGFRKGHCPPTEERLAITVKAGMELIRSLGANNELQK
jgi:uncharacterized metal-binding protein